MSTSINNPMVAFSLSGRDAQAESEVAAILAALPLDHLARRAFARGRTTIDITNHLRDRPDLGHGLMSVCWDHYRRQSPRMRHPSPRAH
ncbi:MAG: hypothetical protein ABI630_05760 [Betaproteobacteria bacterium]